MSTPFSFETTLTARAVVDVVAAYFAPDHLAAQDRVAGLSERKVIEDIDSDTQRKATWSVRAIRPLPIFARPFVEGGRLVYLETLIWRKRDNEIDVTILPQILAGRVSIKAVERLDQVGDHQIRRRYSGEISVDVRLVSGPIERRILAEIEKGMPAMRDATQSWLAEKYRG